MSTQQVEILFICGSPRSHTSEALVALLEQGVRETGARSKKFLLSKRHITPCTGCSFCEHTGTCVMADERAETQPSDDYLELLEAMEHADGLAIVSPLFFAGPPAKLKALYDRMQPFWARRYVLGEKPRAKRPAQVFFLGGGGDPYGFEPLVTISKSALAVAGFSVEKVLNFMGFKHASDVPVLPSEEEAAHIAFGELARLRKAVADQQEFEERARAAGGAFARYVSKQLQKTSQDVELQLYGTKVLRNESTEQPDAVKSEAGTDGLTDDTKAARLEDSKAASIETSATAPAPASDKAAGQGDPCSKEASLSGQDEAERGQ